MLAGLLTPVLFKRSIPKSWIVSATPPTMACSLDPDFDTKIARYVAYRLKNMDLGHKLTF